MGHGCGGGDALSLKFGKEKKIKNTNEIERSRRTGGNRYLDGENIRREEGGI